MEFTRQITCDCLLLRLASRLKASLHGERVAQVGEVTHLGGVTSLIRSPHLSCKRDQINMKDYMDKQVNTHKRVTSPTWGPPPLCKQYNIHPWVLLFMTL